MDWLLLANVVLFVFWFTVGLVLGNIVHRLYRRRRARRGPRLSDRLLRESIRRVR
jgi:hypothetical protein